MSAAELDRVRRELRYLESARRLERACQLLGGVTAAQAAEIASHSRSGNGQDLFALARRGLDSSGYFVEFGASDGIKDSNSYLLETAFGWAGVVAEPARCWHARLMANRTCAIDTRCVAGIGGERRLFNEAANPSLSSVATDGRGSGGTLYDVESLSLLELLDHHRAPPYIDLLSIDTEGTELEILRSFDFSSYRFRTIVCEHNYRASDRAAIGDVLTSAGYRQVHPDLSAHDDWFVDDS